MKVSKKIQRLIIIIFSLFIITVYIYPIIFVNGDLYGRMIEVKSVNKINRELPTVRLVLHKILVEENTIEASLIVYGNKRLFNNEFHVDIHDAYGTNPYGVYNSVSNRDSILFSSDGTVQRAYKSKRFTIPIVNSVYGFPSDEILIRPIVYYMINGYANDFNFEVQKFISGRNLRIIKEENNVCIELVRTNIEVLFVYLSSIIFFIVSIYVGIGVASKKESMRKSEGVIVVAGYLLSIAGFREIIGLSRITGVSALEMAVIGFPLLFLFFVILSLNGLKSSVKKK